MEEQQEKQSGALGNSVIHEITDQLGALLTNCRSRMREIKLEEWIIKREMNTLKAGRALNKE